MILDVQRPEVAFAIDAVRLATQVAKEVQRELVGQSLAKEDKSPVTVADFAAQAIVGFMLDRSFPNDPLVAEEDSESLRAPDNSKMLSQVARFVGQHLAYATPETVCQWIDRGAGESANRFWTLDPIDGTKGFLRADQYAIALALIVDGNVEVGVLGCPNLTNAYTPEHDGPGSLVVAVRGQGTWTRALEGGEWTRLAVSNTSNPADARILRSVEAAHTNISEVDLVAQRLGVQAPAVKMDSQAKYAVMAAGAGEILFRLLSPKRPDYKEKIWDQAAGSLVIEEAGGRITDLQGKPLDFTQGRTLSKNTGVLASNKLLHDAALNALMQEGAAS